VAVLAPLRAENGADIGGVESPVALRADAERDALIRQHDAQQELDGLQQRVEVPFQDYGFSVEHDAVVRRDTAVEPIMRNGHFVSIVAATAVSVVFVSY
jgi:hypothetical protein